MHGKICTVCGEEYGERDYNNHPETRNEKYHNDPFRAVNFKRDESGQPICPGGKRFVLKKNQHVRGNKYGRTEEIYECEDCTGCPLKDKCCKATGNRTIRMNQELSSFHKEVVENLESIHGSLLCMNVYDKGITVHLTLDK